MKKMILSVACLALLAWLINSCKKNSPVNSQTHIGITTSFTEEFDSVYKLSAAGWVMKDNSPSPNSGPYAGWSQGYMGYDKAGVWSGFSAFSYLHTPDEFAYSLVSGSSSSSNISSWFITPVLSVKNGDKISFYTRGDTAGTFTDRMQVLMNRSSASDLGNTSTSTGNFTSVLLDINAAQVPGGYPTTWTKYEYTFSGISGNIDTRIAFRHFVLATLNVKGIGIDLFRFQVN